MQWPRNGEEEMNYESEQAPLEFRQITEALFWANEFIKAAELDGQVQLSQALDWFARAMDAARHDEREAVMRELTDGTMIVRLDTGEEAEEESHG